MLSQEESLRDKRKLAAASVLKATANKVFICTASNNACHQDYHIKAGRNIINFQPTTLDPLQAVVNQNYLQNSQFVHGTKCWRLEYDHEQDVDFSKDIEPQWTVAEGHTAFIHHKQKSFGARVVYDDPKYGEYIPIVPAEEYAAAGRFGLHRAKGSLIVEMYDHKKNLVDTINRDINASFLGGRDINSYDNLIIILSAQPNVSFIRFIIAHASYQHREKGQQDDSYLFFTRCWFGRVQNQTFPGWTERSLEINILNALEKGGAIFEAQLPAVIWQQKIRKLHIENKSTAIPVVGSPIKLTSNGSIRGGIDCVDSIVVKGWGVGNGGHALAVQLYVDGEPVAKGTANQPHEKGQCGFNLIVPNDYCDGRVHYFEIRECFSGVVLGQAAEFVPNTLTEWHQLQEYSGPPYPTHMAPTASCRYKALQDHLTNFALKQDKGKAKRSDLQQITILSSLHAALVRGFEKNKIFEPLEFPRHSSPDVSVVIPVHNKFSVTYNCLAAILFAPNKVSFQVILVDDGSSDKTLELPKLVKNIVYVRNDDAQGFVDACNRGVKEASGKHIVLLNNDTEPTSRWLDELLFVFETFEDVGMVGAKLVYPDGRLQEAGGVVWQSGNPWNYGRLGNSQDPKYNYTRQVDYLSGAAVMLSREVWNQVGGFSEDFRPAYFEDTDLAFKVRDIGLKTVYAPFSVVYHYEGISNGTSVASGMKRYQEINRPKFKRKWAHAFQYNGEEGKLLELNKDRGVHGRVLLLDAQMLRPDMDAGSYAAIQEIRLLQSLGFKATFVPENLAYLGHYTESLQRMGVEVLYAPFYFSIEQILSKVGRDFDIVYLTRYGVAQKYLDLVRAHAPQAKILFCNADLHFLREIRMAIIQKDEERMKAALEVRDMELGVMRKVDVTLSYNETEHAVIASHNLDSSKVVKCPWVVDTQSKVTPFDKRFDIAFLGGYGHPPNIEAVEFFVKEVMPLLRQQLPDVNFRVYGSNVPEAIEKLADDNVVIDGFVNDVGEVYNNRRVFVAPLLSGAGIKGKVIGAMSYGIPVVLSPVAAESTGVRHGHDCFIAETIDDWTRFVVSVYRTQSLWEKLSHNAKAYIAENYSFEKGLQHMRKALETVGIFAPQKSNSLCARSSLPEFL